MMGGFKAGTANLEHYWSRGLRRTQTSQAGKYVYLCYMNVNELHSTATLFARIDVVYYIPENSIISSLPSTDFKNLEPLQK